MTKRILLYGVGSPYTAEVEEICLRLGYEIAAYVANREDPIHATGPAPRIAPGELDQASKALPVAVPLMTPAHRKSVRAELDGLGMTERPALIDPSAVVASTAFIGEGSIVNALCAVGAKSRLGDFVALNRGATIGHDCILGDFVSIGPGATICGGVEIAAGAFIGAGAVVAPELRIGRNCVVAAGAVLRKSIPDNCLITGNPARIAKRGIAGYNGVGV